MDIRPYIEDICRELAVVAQASGDDARAQAERLLAPLESTVRLTLLRALSAAADEITRDLAPGSVEVRLRGLDPSFVVTPAPAEDASEEAPEHARPALAESSRPGPHNGDEGGATARINFRPPEHLKARIEEAAGREGLSVNAWLVRAISTTLKPDHARGERRSPSSGQRYVGWVR
ncbi:MAG: hypothetical protein JOZ47_11800 [Kutzneria sp.]|nr:hypothetical protein [Kutzneria sp.]MBV9845744.1 hypothetical protein [Kutzneria sp.]